VELHVGVNIGGKSAVLKKSSGDWLNSGKARPNDATSEGMIIFRFLGFNIFLGSAETKMPSNGSSGEVAKLVTVR